VTTKYFPTYCKAAVKWFERSTLRTTASNDFSDDERRLINEAYQEAMTALDAAERIKHAVEMRKHRRKAAEQGL